MTALQTRKNIQLALDVTADGSFGPKTLAAYDRLKDAPAASEWPPVATPHSAAFTAFMPFILDWEGRVFENDPDDPGGATKFGIDQRSHPGVSIRDLTEAQAIDIYWDEWLAAGSESRPSPYAEVYFNCAVNMGVGRAREFDATARGNADKFLDLQEAKYRSIASHGTMGKFLKGWLNRTDALRKRFGL